MGKRALRRTLKSPFAGDEVMQAADLLLLVQVGAGLHENHGRAPGRTPWA